MRIGEAFMHYTMAASFLSFLFWDLILYVSCEIKEVRKMVAYLLEQATQSKPVYEIYISMSCKIQRAEILDVGWLK